VPTSRRSNEGCGQINAAKTATVSRLRSCRGACCRFCTDGVFSLGAVDKSAPKFTLPPVLGSDDGLSTQDLVGHVSLVNVFASWCVPCRAEHPLFMELGEIGEVPLYGINYKDPPEQARAWLDELGDPYTRIGADRDGRVGIEWGVYGVPETYVIAADGTIAYRHVGPITRTILQDTIMPIVRNLKSSTPEKVAQ
jgi:cytochrome c biogenesis protein CcmG/thiol:disulfide interchange protein DsbE